MDSDRAGSQGASGVRIVTRQYLFDRMKKENWPNLDSKLNHLKEQLLSFEDYNEHQIVNLKHSFAHFKSELKQRWTKAHYKEENFVKYNRLWLEGTFEIPIVETSQKRPGRPRKSFEEASERSKRRKTEELRSGFEKEIIIHAAQVELGKSGKRDASTVLKDITSTPTRATKYKKAFYLTKSSKEQPSLTPMQALQMFVDADLTQGQYEIIRKTNKTFFPSYSALQKAKKKCYPPQESCTVTSTSAEAQLQPLMDVPVTLAMFVSAEPNKIENSSESDEESITESYHF